MGKNLWMSFLFLVVGGGSANASILECRYGTAEGMPHISVFARAATTFFSDSGYTLSFDKEITAVDVPPLTFKAYWVRDAAWKRCKELADQWEIMKCTSGTPKAGDTTAVESYPCAHHLGNDDVTLKGNYNKPYNNLLQFIVRDIFSQIEEELL